MLTHDRRTDTIPAACREIGISTWTGYDQVRRTGTLCGIPIIRAGRKVLVPRAALERLLAGELPPAEPTASR